jgi:biotin synthase
MTIDKIRVSIGSASVLGLGSIIKFKVAPTTCYVMTFKEGHCLANCGFCPQAKTSTSSLEKLSRVTWPVFSFKVFMNKLKYLPSSKKFKRICIQTLNYPDNFKDLIEIITNIKSEINTPISVAIPPMEKLKLKELKKKGVERVGIALDGSTPEIFERIKGKEINGPYNWSEHIKCLKEALEIFSDGLVSTHIIVGLGETQEDVIKLITTLHDLKVLPSLFAFTPVKGTKFEKYERPNIDIFRKLQLGRFLIIIKNKDLSDFVFNSKGEIIKFNINKRELKEIVDDGEAFSTSGCPGCNRPFYTSKPSGSIYNYPIKPNQGEQDEIYRSLEVFVD